MIKTAVTGPPGLSIANLRLVNSMYKWLYSRVNQRYPHKRNDIHLLTFLLVMNDQNFITNNIYYTLYLILPKYLLRQFYW
jgi:hypothetical protein